MPSLEELENLPVQGESALADTAVEPQSLSQPGPEDQEPYAESQPGPENAATPTPPEPDAPAQTSEPAPPTNEEILAVDPAAASNKRSESLAQTREQKLTEFIAGRQFNVESEVHLEGDEHFVTPLGNKGRHGMVIRSTDEAQDGYIVGATMLKLLQERGVIAGDLRPPKPAKDAAAEASTAEA